MKMGRLTGQDLNWTIDLCKKALLSMPERSIAFLIAPQLASDRRSGLRAEWRKLISDQLLVNQSKDQLLATKNQQI